MYYEWKVCNSKEIENHKFPYLEKSLVLSNYYDQAYRIWMTSYGISLYQTGRFVAVIPFESAGKYMNYMDEDLFKIVKLEDGSYDVYHGRNG